MVSKVGNEQPVVAAINTFYESVWQSGPYKRTCTYEVLQSSPITCTLFHSNESQCHQMRKKEIFLCDVSSFSLLKASFLKVSVLAEGIAWPHVTVCGSSISIQWIMLGHEMGTNRKSLKLPPPFIWFIVSPIFQRVFEYTINLLNLDIKHITPTFIHRSWSVSLTVGSVVKKVENVILKMIVNRPGNLFVTVMSTHNVSHEGKAFTAKQHHRTVCVASKCSPWYRETESMRPLLNNLTDLDHHIIINEIPGNFQCIIDLTVKEISHQIQNVISIKDEPTSDRKTRSPENDLLNYGNNEESTSRCTIAEQTLNGDKREQKKREKEGYDRAVKIDRKHTQVQGTNKLMHSNKLKHSKSQRKSSKVLKYARYQKLFRFILLHCPKCDKKFRYGLYGSGLMYLIGHIYENHKRLTSYCMSTIRKSM